MAMTCPCGITWKNKAWYIFHMWKRHGKEVK